MLRREDVLKPMTHNKRAVAVACAVEISCPTCDESIPAPDGSFMWAHFPSAVTCPICRHTYRLAAKIKTEVV